MPSKVSAEGLAELAGHEDALTADRLRAVLDYDPEHGLLTWRAKPRCKMKAGAVAGTLLNSGYVHVTIDRRRYVAHRLAWLHVHGQWPAGHIDHINGDRSDNRLANLRVASNAENMANAKRYRTNKSGFKGVSLKRGRWRAAIVKNYKQIHLGTFDTKSEAHAAYVNASIALHGEFGRAA